MNAQLKELRGKIDERRKRLSVIFEEAGDDLDMSKVKAIEGDSAAKVKAIRDLNDELSDLVREAEPLEALETIAVETKRMEELGRHPGHVENRQRQATERVAKSLGEMFEEAKMLGPAGERVAKGRSVEIASEIDLKALFTTSAGWAPESIRTGRLVEDAQRPIQVVDVIPGTTTGQAAVVYMEETTFTNAAAETAEGGAFPEAALALTEKSSTVKKVAVWLPVTDEQLEDVPQARGYLNNRLPFMLRQRLDSQILVGDGVGANLLGILNVPGIGAQALGGDTTPDCIYKGLVKCRVTGRSNPNAVIFHPNDWQDVRLLKTVDGIYIWGSPSEAGPMRIWGLPVVETDAITEGTALVGDFANFCELAARRGIEVKVSDSHDTYFVNGKQAVRADMRVAFIVYRPEAFTACTGL